MKITVDIEAQEIIVNETRLPFHVLEGLAEMEPGSVFRLDDRKDGRLHLSIWDLEQVAKLIHPTPLKVVA